MYILSKPSGQPPPDPGPADNGAGTSFKTPLRSDNSQPHSTASSSVHPDISRRPRPQHHIHSAPGPKVPSTTSRPAGTARRGSLPFSFPTLLFGLDNTSSTSLAPSTAEGKPIPIDDTTAVHRTSALRQLNINNPSPVWRPSYGKATSTKSATYSQPVIVRTYSGGSNPQKSGSSSRPHAGHYGPPGAVHRNPPRFLTSAHSTTAVSTKSAPLPRPITITTSHSSRNAKPGASNMSSTKTKTKSKVYWPWKYLDPSHGQAEPKLPPLEAFSFKGFLADLQDSELNSNIDGIAEICARSKYSLSNQYEVHMTPHGSGEEFLAGSRPPSVPRKRRHRKEQGPTLQAVQSDDDESHGRGHRRRRGPGRRRSMAYGTLETIMSSSRSSEEDKSKKKSAAELAEEVRSRAASQGSSGPSGQGSGSTTRAVAGEESNGADDARAVEQGRPKRRKSTSFAHAVIDSTRHGAVADTASPRGSASALVSGPALPQTSSSHLEIRTTPVEPLDLSDSGESSPTSPTGSANAIESSFGEAPLVEDPPQVETATVAPALSSWVPWRSTEDPRQSKARSDAERNLRGLLKDGRHH